MQRGASVLIGLATLVCAATMAAQVSDEQTVANLTSPDADVRLRAAQMLKESAHPEAAIPLAALVTDPRDEVQLEAIAAELNIFLAEKVVPRKRVGFVIEVRGAIAAEPAFSGTPLTLSARPVPIEVLTALRTAFRDDNPRVGLEALYAFGALAVQPGGAERRDLLRASGPDLAAGVGAVDFDLRYGAVRVLGRLFEKLPQDEPVDELVGDALVAALNDRDPAIKAAAMQGLGAMRYDRAVQSLTDLYQYHGRGPVAEAALDALARIANPASTAVLSSALTSKTTAVRGIAIEGLARLGDPSALADIEAATKTERADGVRLAAAFAAAMLGGGSIDPIVEALGRSRVREQAQACLVELARTRQALIGAALQAADARVRADLADAISVGRNSAALPLVEPLVTDQDPHVARAAERAVARLRSASRKPVS